MIYTKITSPDSNTITLEPLQIGKYKFSEFEVKAYDSNSISRDICFRDRTAENINVTASSLIDGTTALTEAAYWMYACFKNKKLDKIGLVKEGNTVQNYEYYTKINFVISVNSSGNILTFSDAEIKENMLVDGGWYSVADNSLYATSNIEDYNPTGATSNWERVQFRRVNGTVHIVGLARATAGISAMTDLINIPYGFRNGNYYQMWAGTINESYALWNYDTHVLQYRLAIASGNYINFEAFWKL